MSTFIFATTRRLSIAHLLSLFVLHPPWYKWLHRFYDETSHVKQ